MPAIEVKGLSKRFGATLAVDDLSFTVDSGRILGFLGPNGAGKTTTLRALLGLIHPTAGSATIEGRPYAQLDDPAGTVGAVLDGGMFHPGRSGRNHLRALALSSGVETARVEELLELVSLADAADRRAGGYSLGMRQRLGLAAALLGDPRVLVLDEPANGLDPQGIRWLRDFLRSLATEGCAILVSSHVLSEVAQTVDDVVVIHRGRSIEQAPIGELLAGRGGGVRVAGPDVGRLAELLRGDGAEVTAGANGDIVVADRSGEQVGAVIGALAWLFMIEPLLTAIPRVGEWVEDFGVGAAMGAIGDSTTNTGSELGQLTGGLALLAYAAVFAAAGALLLRGRDISA